MNLTPFVLALSRWSAPSSNGFSEAMRLGAFRALDDLGLVQIDQNRGAFKIDLDEAIEIHDVYSALEELAARSAARRLSGTQIAELKSLVESMEAAAAAEDLDRYCSLDVDFHQRLMERSGNRRLLRVYNRLVNELHLVPRFDLMQRGEMQRSSREYHQILDRIAAGEPEAAAEAMRCHTSERRRKMLLSSGKFDPSLRRQPRLRRGQCGGRDRAKIQAAIERLFGRPKFRPGPDTRHDSVKYCS